MTERLQDSTVREHQKPRSRSKTHSEQESSDLPAVFQYGAQRYNEEQHAFKYHLIKDSRATRKAEHEHLKTSIIKQLENR